MPFEPSVPRGSRAEQFYGAHDADRLFGGHPTALAPFGRGGGGLKARRPYDMDLVEHAVAHPEEYPLVGHDPRHLSATQGSVVRDGVDYYLTDEYHRTGKTHKDMHQSGNRFPVVYNHTERGQSLILSGHHRATAALLRGEQFQARTVEGGWGAEYDRR